MIRNFTSLRQLLSRRFSKTIRYTSLFILVCLLAQSTQAGNRLPVFATELAVSSAGPNLVISWQADKAAFSYYEVEKSADGQHFSTIGLVLDAPENSTLCMFKDKMPVGSKAKTVWYRIKAIDKDGVPSYSSITNYVLESAAPTCAAFAFPNPFTNAAVVNFKTTEAGFAQLTVEDLNGQILLSKQSHIIKGYNSVGLDGLASLSRGVYVARLSINGNVIGNQKLIKK